MKILINYSIVPTIGDTVSAIGEIDGLSYTTTPIIGITKANIDDQFDFIIETTSGSKYGLREKNPGLWFLPLTWERPLFAVKIANAMWDKTRQ